MRHLLLALPILFSCATAPPVSIAKRTPVEEVLAGRPNKLTVSEEPPAWALAPDAWYYKDALYGVGRSDMGKSSLAKGAAENAALAMISKRLESFISQLDRRHEKNGEQTTERLTKSFTAGFMKDVVVRAVWHDGKERWAVLAELRDPVNNFIGATKDHAFSPMLEKDPMLLLTLLEAIQRPVCLLPEDRC